MRLSRAERDFMDHALRFGEAALIRKAGRRWTVEYGSHASPELFATRREALAMARLMVGMLIDRDAGRI